MSDISDKLGGVARPEKAITEEQVRRQLLQLASDLADAASKAATPGDAQIYGETAAVVFDAARIRQTDVPPDRGRLAQVPTDVPPDRG